MGDWIDLAAFAEKYSVSQSTLRRRIRARTIPFKLEKGKYLLQDTQEILNAAPLYSRGVGSNSHITPSERSHYAAPAAPIEAPMARMTFAARSAPLMQSAPAQVAAPQVVRPAPMPAAKETPAGDLILHDPVGEFLRSDEVLPVYMHADLERLRNENRMLRREIAELQTLVKALESEVL